jgi:hypothetical protein
MKVNQVMALFMSGQNLILKMIDAENPGLVLYG